MTTRIRIPLSEVTNEFIEALKKKYNGDIRIDIQVVEDEKEDLFSEDSFWAVIEQLDWSQEEDELILAPAIEFLSQLDPSGIYRFQDILAQKLSLLDKQSYAEQIGEDAFQLNQSFSSDNFLYARCCAIANGKSFFEAVLADPTQMPKDLTFEPLLYLAQKAFHKKTGLEFDYFPTTNFETYSNANGWENDLLGRLD